MTERREPDAESRRCLQRYFGGRVCVVDGHDGAHWHHLDDDATSPRFEDLVPLGAHWNLALRDARRRASQDGQTYVPVELMPDLLVSRAELCLASWSTARAYGLSRLAYYVGRRYVGSTADQLVLYSAGTTRALRHRPDVRLIHDVLHRDLLPVTHDPARIGGVAARRMLLELACLAGEFRDLRRGHAIHRFLAPRLRRQWDGDPWYANARRRADTVRAVVEDTPRQAVARLKAAAARAPANPGIRIGSDVFAALHLYDAGEPRRARDLLEPHYAAVVPPLMAFADGSAQFERTARPPLNASPTAHYLQTYALTYDATTPGPRGRRRRDYDAMLTNFFRFSGALLDSEAPFRWSDVLGGDERRTCTRLPASTTRLLDRAVGNLVAALR